MEALHDLGDDPTRRSPSPRRPRPRTGAAWRWSLLAGSVTVLVAAVALLVVVVRAERSSQRGVTASSDTTTTAAIVTTIPVAAATSSSTVAPPVSSVPPGVPSGPDVSPSAIAARVDQYLAAGAGDDLERFESQWSYPIVSYYGVQQATMADVAQKAGDYWTSYPSRTFTRVGKPSIALAGGAVRATAQFHFVLVDDSGALRCGTNTLSFVFARSEGLPIRSIDEVKGPSGC